MTRLPRTNRPALRAPATFLRNFARGEDGMITIFACFMIFCMLMIGGIGVDMMRHEMERTRIQGCADRAVLAAADLDQTLNPEAVVRDYFDKCGMTEFVSGVDVEEGLNYRTVTVDATTDVNTMFMDYFGVQELSVPAISAAEEKVNKVEISLVLDISGSMNDNNKMQNLKNAASVFVDTVLTPENQDLISVSVVPYSEQVNAGPLLFNQLQNIRQMHSYSYCVEIPDQEFGHARFNWTREYDQMQHFQWNYYSIQSGSQQNTRYDTVCPRSDYEEILPFSQNAAEIKGKINQFRPRAGTSIFLGMKWGVGLLDPGTQSVVSNLAGSGNVDAVFSDRPKPYNDMETLKTVILMTDGENQNSYRIPYRYYNSESLYEHWNRYNLQYYINRYVSYRYRTDFYEQKYNAAIGDALLLDICDAAKDENIIIWTIGFETTTRGKSVMRECASSQSHYFDVEGTEISEAFSTIARYINQLRLTL